MALHKFTCHTCTYTYTFTYPSTPRRMQQALGAIEKLRSEVDTLIIVSNDRLLQIIPENTPLQKAFAVADDVLRQGVCMVYYIWC